MSACGPRSSTWPTVSLLFFVFHFFFPQTTPPHPNHSSHLSPHTTLTVKAVCGERGAPAPPGKAIAIKIFDRVLPLETQVRGWMERGNGERERGGAPPAAFPPSVSLSLASPHTSPVHHTQTHTTSQDLQYAVAAETVAPNHLLLGAKERELVTQSLAIGAGWGTPESRRALLLSKMNA